MKEELTLINSIENRWCKLKTNEASAKGEREEEVKAIQKGYLDNMEMYSNTLASLKSTNQKAMNKINKINSCFDESDQLLQLLRKRRQFQPIQSDKDMNKLSFSLFTTIQCQTLDSRKAEIEKIIIAKCDAIKNQITQLKIKLSLTDIEINERCEPRKKPFPQ